MYPSDTLNVTPVSCQIISVNYTSEVFFLFFFLFCVLYFFCTLPILLIDIMPSAAYQYIIRNSLISVEVIVKLFFQFLISVKVVMLLCKCFVLDTLCPFI